MAKGDRGRLRIASRWYRPTTYPLRSYTTPNSDKKNNCSKIFIQDWENATCSICMECPHNAVLLLCSSHVKGCRPYMCGTSFRHSNCLDQYKKAYTKTTPSNNTPIYDASTEVMDPLSGRLVVDDKATELTCPLCRGQVKGWTVVEPARDHLNAKQRTCNQDNCSFIGTYKELQKHVRTEHASAKPREADPTLEEKWRNLEQEREREDVRSTIRSSNPGALFFGDYVIERNHFGLGSDGDADVSEPNEEIENGIGRRLMSVMMLLQEFDSEIDRMIEARATLQDRVVKAALVLLENSTKAATTSMKTKFLEGTV
ncbi:hypothetical protein F511_30432 [Dorcoceras hygrometricum]|uniref:Uncharacterized protein n=1 Tax=Dorcoceras hygrometricum TaxID=472368 RepID=A0A2Z7AI48_9LAMI|nr:hypothetical protein F511_30432 [Dorcoceras hygrometricum]